MLPGSGCECWSRWMMSMVSPCVGRGNDHAAASACALGPAGPSGARSALPHHPPRRDPNPLPWRRARCGPAPARPWSATPLPARLGTGVGPGGRPGPPRGRGGQCPVDVSAAGRLPGRADRPSGGDRHGQGGAAPRRGCLQAAPVGADPQGPRPAGMGKQRLRVEALLGAAASPQPPPAADLVPDATLADDLVPENLPRLLDLLGRADLYLQDEVEVALHPTLTRVWSRRGRAGQ